MHSTESRFVIGPSNILFSGVYGALFSQEILQAGAVKGLIQPSFLCWGTLFRQFKFLPRTVPKNVFSKSETLLIFKAFVPHGDAKNAGTQAGCQKTSQKLNGGRKRKKAVSYNVLRAGKRVKSSTFRQFLSELRSCVKVKVAVLGSRP